MALLLGDEPTTAPDTLSIDTLVPFSGHPFKPYSGERLNDMVQSIKELGVLLPVIVRPLPDDDGTFEILSGHNRVAAAKIAGLTEVPVIIKASLSDGEAKLIVTESNLCQRSFADLSHSERAIALKTHMDAVNQQGRRTDLINEIIKLSNPHGFGLDGTSDPLGKKLTPREQATQLYGLSSTNLARYLRVAQLIDPLLSRVDDGGIAIRPAVSLSYLTGDEQSALNQLLYEAHVSIDMKKAENLRTLSATKKLTADKMVRVLSGEQDRKPKKTRQQAIKLKPEVMLRYFTQKQTPKEVAEIVVSALEFYFAHKAEDNQLHGAKPKDIP